MGLQKHRQAKRSSGTIKVKPTEHIHYNKDDSIWEPAIEKGEESFVHHQL